MGEQRDPLLKDKFLGGNRQKWCGVFLVCGFGVLLCDVLVTDFDPVPYTNFLLALSTTFILGQSATDWAKTNQVGSIRNAEVSKAKREE